MGRTYEALEWAEREFQARRQTEPFNSSEADRPRGRQPDWLPPGLTGFEDLKSNLQSRYADRRIQIILFAGTAHGDGTSTAALNFAASLTRDSQVRVLLIDATLGAPGWHSIFQGKGLQNLADLVTQNGFEPLRIGVEAENIHLLPSGGAHPDPLGLIKSRGFDVFLEKARNGYDYVILDAPPIQASPYCRMLCAKADGVVLVIRSGKTRREDALRAKKQLEEARGKILGVVLNRRKCYVPNFVNRRF